MSALLADPAQVAAVRALIAAARQAGAEHYTYAFNDHLGHPVAAQEHVWTLGLSTVSYEDGRLMYERNDRNGTWLLKAQTTDARQVADLLTAIGAMPTELSIQPTIERPYPFDGTQRLYRFANGYGASVVRFTLGHQAASQDADKGLWELAVIKYEGKGDKYEVVYDTPVTDDLIGLIDEDAAQALLRQIRDLPAGPR
jgi:hypothetical protein